MSSALSGIRGSLHSFRIPSFAQLFRLPSVLTLRERLVFIVGCLALIAGISLLSTGWYRDATELRPAIGGTYVEGLLGEPRFVNPLFATTSDVDRDLVALIYAGLFRIDEQGRVVPDLAESYALAATGNVVTVMLRDDLRWHDGAELTADDVVFTMQLLQDAAVASPIRGSFRGVKAERVDDRTITFTTERPLAVFLSALTVGILPEHLWIDIPPAHLPLAELNLRPIGSGPYRFVGLTKDRQGTIRSYTLERSPGYHLAAPRLERLTFRFATDPSELTAAFDRREIDGIGALLPLAPNALTRTDVFRQSFELPQTTAIFLNQRRNPALKDIAVRRALSEAVDRTGIIRDALHGAGRPIGGPIIPGFSPRAEPPEPDTYDPAAGAARLQAAKWVETNRDAYVAARTKAELVKLEIAKKKAGKKKNELAATPEERSAIDANVAAELSEEQASYRMQGDAGLHVELTTPDAPELVAIATSTQRAWRAIGVRTTVHVLPLEQVRGEIIPNREYDALLFSQILGPDPDPFPFWHSSQVRHPGLNLSYFSNRTIDGLLEDARATLDRDVRAVKYAEFQERLLEERPAIFLATPTFTYAVTTALQGVRLGQLTQPHDRFATITEWYTETERIWKTQHAER